MDTEIQKEWWRKKIKSRIFQKGDRSTYKNYRTTNALSCMGKCLKRIIENEWKEKQGEFLIEFVHGQYLHLKEMADKKIYHGEENYINLICLKKA